MQWHCGLRLFFKKIYSTVVPRLFVPTYAAAWFPCQADAANFRQVQHSNAIALRCDQAKILECSFFFFSKPCDLLTRDTWESKMTIFNDFLFSSVSSLALWCSPFSVVICDKCVGTCFYVRTHANLAVTFNKYSNMWTTPSQSHKMENQQSSNGLEMRWPRKCSRIPCESRPIWGSTWKEMQRWWLWLFLLSVLLSAWSSGDDLGIIQTHFPYFFPKNICHFFEKTQIQNI